MGDLLCARTPALSLRLVVLRRWKDMQRPMHAQLPAQFGRRHPESHRKLFQRAGLGHVDLAPLDLADCRPTQSCQLTERSLAEVTFGPQLPEPAVGWHGGCRERRHEQWCATRSGHTRSSRSKMGLCGSVVIGTKGMTRARTSSTER